MRLVEIFSQAVRSCFRRFPAPSAFATALALYAIIIILLEVTNHQLLGAIGYFLSVGLVLSLSLALWSEEHERTKKVTRVHVIAYVILLIDTIYLFYSDVLDSNGVETLLLHTSAIVALVLSVFFLSFTRERDDIPSWNFALRVIVSIAVCYLIGLVLIGGLSLLFVSLRWLFTINLGWKWYAITAVLFGGYLPTLLLLGRIPCGDLKHDLQPLSSSFFAGVFRYLFLPLEALYLAVLYIYAIQILISWELPNGQVSWLVIASFIGHVAIELGLYPTRRAENRSFDNAIARLLPLILLPLLMLMTVGIVRRFNDYGLTIARLYIITLNAWFYLVCLVLFFTRARRISWIPISFSVLFLLTSALPVNYTSITRRVLYNKAEHALTQAGATDLPLNASTYDSLMHTLSPEERTYISSKLVYLKYTYGNETIQPLVEENQKSINYYDYICTTEDREQDSVVIASKNDDWYNNFEAYHIHMPAGYTDIYRGIRCKDFPCDADCDTLEVPVSVEDIHETVLVSPADLKRYHEQMDGLVTFPTRSGNSLFLMNHFFLSQNTESDSLGGNNATLDIEGYLLTK